MKKWILNVSAVLFVSVLLALLASHFYSTFNSKAKAKKVNINYEVYGTDLKDTKITPGIIRGKAGDVIILKTDDFVEKKIKAMNPVNIPLADIVAFTIPGKEGIYHLGHRELETVIILEEDGVIEFFADYPTTLTKFTTFNIVNKQKISGPAVLEAKISKNAPSHFAKPKRLSKIKGPLGVALPNVRVEKDERNFNLRDLAKEEGDKIPNEIPVPEKVKEAKNNILRFWEESGI